MKDNIKDTLRSIADEIPYGPDMHEAADCIEALEYLHQDAIREIAKQLRRAEAAEEQLVEAWKALKEIQNICVKKFGGEDEHEALNNIFRAVNFAVYKDPSTTYQAEYIARYGTDDGL